jgi:hypothetical protein
MGISILDIETQEDFNLWLTTDLDPYKRFIFAKINDSSRPKSKNSLPKYQWEIHHIIPRFVRADEAKPNCFWNKILLNQLDEHQIRYDEAKPNGDPQDFVILKTRLSRDPNKHTQRLTKHKGTFPYEIPKNVSEWARELQKKSIEVQRKRGTGFFDPETGRKSGKISGKLRTDKRDEYYIRKQEPFLTEKLSEGSVWYHEWSNPFLYIPSLKLCTSLGVTLFYKAFNVCFKLN